MWVWTDGQLVLVVDLVGAPQLGHCPVGPAGPLVRLWTESRQLRDWQIELMNSFFPRYFDELSELIAGVDDNDLDAVVDLLEVVAGSSCKVLLAGNGGSAAVVNHVTVDLVRAAGIRAVNFNESSLVTCFANDYGYDQWVAKSLLAHSDPGDLVILVSSSGESDNIVNAARVAEDLGLSLVVLSGFDPDNRLRSHGDVSLWVDSRFYNHVENSHQVWLLAVVDRFIASRRGESAVDE